jgi:hypothetical protein
MSGKHIVNRGGNGFKDPQHLIFKLQPTKLFSGGFRVTTPAASVAMASAQFIPAAGWIELVPTIATFDNNAFWSPTDHPARLVAKAAGLYLLGAHLYFNPENSGYRLGRIMVNDTTQIDECGLRVDGNSDRRENMCTIWFLNAGDYITSQALVSGPASNCLLTQFFLAGITPESVI